MGSKKIVFDATSRLEKKSERATRKPRRASMSSVGVASHATPSFFAHLFKEFSITDVNLVADNAKPRATIPRSVYSQSPKSIKENKSLSRWDSIVRTDSQDIRDINRWNPRRGRRRGEVHSLSPSPLSRIVERQRSQTSNDCEPADENLFEKFNCSEPCLNYKGSYAPPELPDTLRDDLFELVRADDNIKTSQDRIQEVQKLFGPMPRPMRQKSIESILDRSPSPPRSEVRGRDTLDFNDRPDPVRERSSSDPSLRIPQRRASKDLTGEEPAPSRPRRARRRASIDSVPLRPTRKDRSPKKSIKPSISSWWKLGREDGEGDSDSNKTDTTHELTPSPTTSMDKTSQLLTLTIEAPPLNPPSTGRATRRSSLPSMLISSKKKSSRPKSPPPPDQPATPPTIKQNKRSSKDSKKKKNKKRSTSPPPEQPGTPPSLKRDHRTRRHSDSIIDIDMEVCEKLLYLSQIASPTQPVRQRSIDPDEGHIPANQAYLDAKKAKLIAPTTTITEEDIGATIPEDSVSDGRDEKGEQVMEEAQQCMGDKGYCTAEEGEGKIPEDDGADKSPRNHKVQFAPKTCFSPTKKTLPNRVSFSPKRIHSAPIVGQDPRKEDDDAALLSSFRRRKPYTPGKAFNNTSVVATKTGGLTRTRTKSKQKKGQNRDFIQASLCEHSSKGHDILFNANDSGSSIETIGNKSLLLDTNDSSSSIETAELKTIAEQMPPAPSLDSPLQGKKKKKSRRSSLPHLLAAPNLADSSTEPKKKKKNRRRSVD